MSFSTTCKALCLCLALLALIMPSACAQADLPAEQARVLLVYDAANGAMHAQDVEHMSTMMTAMIKSLSFGDIREFADSLSQYEYVICYRLEEIGEQEMAAIQAYQGNLLIMGSDFMKRYLLGKGEDGLIEEESSFDRGVLRFAFSPEDTFEEIVRTENIARFVSQDGDRGTITVGDWEVPFFSRVGSVRFTPVTSLSANLARAALMQELTYWMWPYLDSPPDYGQYLVLDAIYPFMDARMLLDRVDALIEEGIPYVLSVMPIYRNSSYPAMVQFCQVLQYAQKNGGFVVLHAPIVQTPAEDAEEMYDVLTQALLAYTDNGVYPLGIQAPLRWTNDDFYLSILRRYRTVFIYDDGEDSTFALDAGHNRLYDNHHQLVMPAIPLDGSGASPTTCYSSAIYLDAYTTAPQEIHELVSAMKGRRVPFQSLWDLNHAVWANDTYLRYESGMLYQNDTPLQLVYEPVEYDERHDYSRGVLSRITISLQRQNRLLTAVTAIVVALFASFMIYLRRANRKSFFFDEE